MKTTSQTGWESKEYQALLSQSASEADTAKRLEILKQAEAIAMADFPVAPIYYYTNLYVVKDYVAGMEPDGLSNYNFKYVDVNR